MSKSNTSSSTEDRCGLVGDYRFHQDDPWRNDVEGGLPALRPAWAPGGDSEVAHGVGAAVTVPCPVLYGLVPAGGGADGQANNNALAWTHLVRATIPEHPDLDLGKRFTLWLRFYFAGTPEQGQAGWPVRLLTRWTSPPDRGYVLWCRPPGVITCTAAFDDFCATWEATDPAMLLMQVGWYDVGVAHDGQTLAMHCTRIGTDGPGTTAVQCFAADAGLLDAAFNETGGELRVLQYGAMLEHLLLYRNQALNERQIRELSAGVTVPAAACATPAVEVGTDRQLFPDDAVISETRGLTRHWHTARKDGANPLLFKQQGDAPDYSGPSGQVSVLHDHSAGVWRLWFHQHRRSAIETFCCHTTSADGLAWSNMPFAGSVPDGAVHIENPRRETMYNLKVVWQDLDEPDPDRRFKAFGRPMDFYTSPDGLHWINRGIAIYGADDASMAAWLPQRRKHLFALRPLMTGKPPGYRTQAMALCDAPLDNRIPAKLVFTPDEADLAADPHLQFYHMPVYEYCNWLISPMTVYHSDDATDGRLETQWAFSRDGLDWQRPTDRGPAIALGESGTWDSASVYAASTLTELDDELRFYYSGSPNRHFESAGSCGIGLARLRRDGFVSLDARAEGTMTTIPFRCLGSRLLVNAVVIAGAVRVAVLDALGTPIPGFTVPECRAFQGDATDHTASWQNDPDLSTLQGQVIRLHFELTHGQLFAFQIAP